LQQEIQLNNAQLILVVASEITGAARGFNSNTCISSISCGVQKIGLRG